MANPINGLNGVPPHVWHPEAMGHGTLPFWQNGEHPMAQGEIAGLPANTKGNSKHLQQNKKVHFGDQTGTITTPEEEAKKANDAMLGINTPAPAKKDDSKPTHAKKDDDDDDDNGDDDDVKKALIEEAKIEPGGEFVAAPTVENGLPAGTFVPETDGVTSGLPHWQHNEHPHVRGEMPGLPASARGNGNNLRGHHETPSALQGDGEHTPMAKAAAEENKHMLEHPPNHHEVPLVPGHHLPAGNPPAHIQAHPGAVPVASGDV
jgi:hypothetical protein